MHRIGRQGRGIVFVELDQGAGEAGRIGERGGIGIRLELILGLELFRRLAVRRSLALLHCKTIVMIFSQQITYEFLPPAVPRMSATPPRQLV